MMMNVVVLVVLTIAAHVGAADYVITGDCPWVVPSNITTGEMMAFEDVQRDWYAATGHPPIVVTDPSLLVASVYDVPNPNLPFILFGTPETAPWLSGLNTTGCLVGWETHCIKVVDNAFGSHPAVILTGTGARGSIFAAYSFAEEVLGAHPMKYFIDLPVPYQGSITLPFTEKLFPVPQFKYRGPFMNDEDLFGNWKPSPMGESTFSQDAYNEFYSMTLRCKLNTVLPDTNPFPDSVSLALASRRGLVVTTHHYDTLNLNVYRWPLGTDDWDWTTDPGTMAWAYKQSIAAQNGYEVVWVTGLRGLNDYKYTHCNGDAQCGAIISNAIAAQASWITEMDGEDAMRVIYLWDEGLTYFQNGDLKVPNGTLIVFGDEGAGFVHGNSTLYSEYAGGLYYHVMMQNGHANQLMEMVPVSRIIEQMGTFIRQAKATEYGIINISDLRPAPMTALASFKMLYDPSVFGTGNPNDTATTYMTSWCKTAYGLSDADAATAAAWFNDWFAVPFIANGDGEQYLLNDLGIRDIGQPFSAGIRSSDHSVPSSLVQQATQAKGVLTEALPLLADLSTRAQALLDKADPSRRQFLTAHIVYQAEMCRGLANATMMLAQAVLAFTPGDPSKKSAGFIELSLAEFESVFAAQRAAEGTGGSVKWKGLYFGDRLSDIHGHRRLVLDVQMALLGTMQARPVRANGDYNSFYSYQVPHLENWPMLHFTPDANLNLYIRMRCALEAGPTCVNTVDGASFNTSSVLVAMVNQAGHTIRYTTDGSDPTGSSTEYPKAGVTITKSTTFKAGAFNGSALLGGVTTGVFTQTSAEAVQSAVDAPFLAESR